MISVNIGDVTIMNKERKKKEKKDISRKIVNIYLMFKFKLIGVFTIVNKP
jgi:hypothetical protein